MDVDCSDRIRGIMIKILLLFLIGYVFIRFISMFFKVKFIKIDRTGGGNFGNQEIDITERVRVLDGESKKSGESRGISDIKKD